MTSVVRLGSRRRAGLAFWGATLVALLVSHDAVYLAQVGPGDELARTLRHAAHDYWGVASGVLAAAAAVAGVGAAARLRDLRQRVASLNEGSPVARARTGGRAYRRRLVATWAAMAAVVAIGFLLQENAEHVRAHGHVLGVGALAGPEYPLAIPVIGVVTLVASALAAVVRGVEEALVAAIVRALRTAVRPASRLEWPPFALPGRWLHVTSANPERGPPSTLVATQPIF